MKGLKARIRRGDTLFGCWLNLGSPVTAEIVGLAGFDWVLIDFEHGSGSENDVLHQLQALEHTPAAALVRVESWERQRFHRVLDFGAEGVMCPRIRSLDEAQRAAEAMRYPPEGARGAAMMVRATRFGTAFQEYYATSGEHLVGVVQIETEEILDSLDAVAQLDAVDVLFIGPLDLSIALGTFGQPNHPRFLEAVRATSAAARKAGKAAGVLVRSPEEFAAYRELGFRFVACGSDSGFVNSGARETVRVLNDLRSSSSTEA